MCGIVGAITKKQNIPIDKMTDIMAHRGPDDRGIYHSQFDNFSIYLGHRRLAIIDLTQAGHQPMSNEDKTIWLIYNGELYNFSEIKKQLQARGYQFHSRTDSEVVLYAYQEWGIDCLKKFNGMFAFGIWDKRKNLLFLGRDHVGMKPLYYGLLPDKGIIFASEIKAILTSGLIKREVNIRAIPGYLAFLRVHAPQTMFKNIYKLEAGQYLLWQHGKIKKGIWWEPIDKAQSSKFKIQNLEDELECLLKRAIKRHMISDVGLGVFLSGGLDSSIITTLASQITDQPLKTFTIGFSKQDLKKEGTGKDELIFARLLKEKLGFKIDYNEIILSPQVLEVLPKIAWHIDEPICDPAAINAYLICQAAKQRGVTVLLSGMGGDEVFAGYNHYLIGNYIRYFDRLGILGKGVLKTMRLLLGSLPNYRFPIIYPYLRYLKRKGKFLDQSQDLRYIEMSSWLTKNEVGGILSDEIKKEVLLDKYQESKLSHFQKFQKKDILWRMQYTDLKTFLADHNLTYTDKASMAASAEVRAPLLDRQIIEFMFSLPTCFKIKNFQTKYLLKKTAQKFLPKEIIFQKKSGFSVPIRSWFRQLTPLINDLLSPTQIEKQGYFDSGFIQEMIKKNTQGKEDCSYQLWALLIFQLWHQNFIEKKLA